MRVISISEGLGAEEEIKGEPAGVFGTLVGSPWKIDGAIRYEGVLYYVIVFCGPGYHRVAENSVATQVVRRIMYGTVVLARKGDELP